MNIEEEECWEQLFVSNLFIGATTLGHSSGSWEVLLQLLQNKLPTVEVVVVEVEEEEEEAWIARYESNDGAACGHDRASWSASAQIKQTNEPFSSSRRRLSTPNRYKRDRRRRNAIRIIRIK